MSIFDHDAPTFERAGRPDWARPLIGVDQDQGPETVIPLRLPADQHPPGWGKLSLPEHLLDADIFMERFVREVWRHQVAREEAILEPLIIRMIYGNGGANLGIVIWRDRAGAAMRNAALWPGDTEIPVGRGVLRVEAGVITTVLM